jgi:L-ribulose-5-phosphate 4-epimerase
MIDDGVIKFVVDHSDGPAPEGEVLMALDRWRSRLHDAGLIGEYAQAGVGYGNVSARLGDGSVAITGTQTGRAPRLGPHGYTRVLDYDLARNYVRSAGPLRPSSETLAHMALYDAIPGCAAVFHVHDSRAWQALRFRLPTTRPEVPYGTPAMARELARLYQDTSFAQDRLAVMAGHEDGLIAFGACLDDAGTVLLTQLRGSQ